MIAKMSQEPGRRIGAQSEKLEVFNKGVVNIQNNQTERNNKINEMHVVSCMRKNYFIYGPFSL